MPAAVETTAYWTSCVKEFLQTTVAPPSERAATAGSRWIPIDVSTRTSAPAGPLGVDKAKPDVGIAVDCLFVGDKEAAIGSHRDVGVLLAEVGYRIDLNLQANRGEVPRHFPLLAMILPAVPPERPLHLAPSTAS